MKKRIVAMILSLVLVLVLIPVPSSAAADDVVLDKTASPVALNSSCVQTGVTLSVAGTSGVYAYDVVLVLDASVSVAYSSAYTSVAKDAIDKLAAFRDVEIRLGIIQFSGTVWDGTSRKSGGLYEKLVPVNDTTVPALKNAINLDFSDQISYTGTGTNIHGGLQMAQQWLEEDTEVPDTNKIIFLLTDGKTNLWSDDDGNPTAIYTRGIKDNWNELLADGFPSREQSISRGKFSIPYTTTTAAVRFDNFDQLYASDNEELTGVAPYDVKIDYGAEATVTKYFFYQVPSSHLDGTVTDRGSIINSGLPASRQNGPYGRYYEYVPDSACTDIRYQESNPYELTDNGNGTWSYDFTRENPDFFYFHVSGLEKSLYKAAHLFSELNDKYITAVAVEESGSYTNVLNTLVSSGKNGFNKWLTQAGDYSVLVNHQGSAEDQAAVEGVLDAAMNNFVTGIHYSIEDVYLEDVIGDDFDMVIADGICPVTLKVGDTVQTAVYDGDTRNWNFGPQSGGSYPYVLKIASDCRSFVIDINTYVDPQSPLSCSYDLILKPESRVNGVYDTNETAYIDKYAESFRHYFPVPQVTYQEDDPVVPPYIPPYNPPYNPPSGPTLYGYTIEYYFDDVPDSTKTEYGSARKASVVDQFSDYSSDRYELEKTWNVPMVISSQEADNVMRIYFRTKSGGLLDGKNHYAYIVGYPDGTVRPEGDITRAEVATVFFKLLRDEVRQENLTGTNSFTDVSEGSWYNIPVSTLYSMGILSGFPDGCFKPDEPITRGEFIAIASRFDGLQASSESVFTDIASHWASDAIVRAAELGWISGYSDGSFRPDAPITRAEAMAIFNQILGRLPETKTALLNEMIAWPDNPEDSWYYLYVQEATNSHDYRLDEMNREYWTCLIETPSWKYYSEKRNGSSE